MVIVESVRFLGLGADIHVAHASCHAHQHQHADLRLVRGSPWCQLHRVSSLLQLRPSATGQMAVFSTEHHEAVQSMMMLAASNMQRTTPVAMQHAVLKQYRLHVDGTRPCVGLSHFLESQFASRVAAGNPDKACLTYAQRTFRLVSSCCPYLQALPGATQSKAQDGCDMLRPMFSRP